MERDCISWNLYRVFQGYFCLIGVKAAKRRLQWLSHPPLGGSRLLLGHVLGHGVLAQFMPLQVRPQVRVS
jgi:hypothetical protein